MKDKKNHRIAVSTGMIDKRCINGNNGVKRGKDKKKRRRVTEYYVLKDEVKASLKVRLDIVLEYYGSKAEMSRRIRVKYATVCQWFKRGMISAKGAQQVHRDYRRNGCQGYSARFCRPDLRFDRSGRPMVKKCERKEMLRPIRPSDLKKAQKDKKENES